jgi:WD40 repeat protein
MLVSGGCMGDRSIRIWRLATGDKDVAPKVARVISGQKGLWISVRFSPDNKTIASASSDGSVAIWSVENGQQLLRFRGHRQVLHGGRRDGEGFDDEVYCLAWSPHGRVIASGSREIVLVWDAQTGAEVMPPLRVGSAQTCLSLCFSSDGKFLVGSCIEGHIRIWKLAHTAYISFRVLKCPAHVTDISLSPDSR